MPPDTSYRNVHNPYPYAKPLPGHLVPACSGAADEMSRCWQTWPPELFVGLGEQQGMAYPDTSYPKQDMAYPDTSYLHRA